MLRALISLLCLHTAVCFLPLCVQRGWLRQPASRAQPAGRIVSVRPPATNKRWLCTGASGEQGIVSNLSAATPLRFSVGEGVIVNTGLGTVAGVVVEQWYREQGWPDHTVVPYWIELEDGRLVYAVEDSDVLVRAAGAEPFEERYPPVALHPELFEPENVDAWFLPELRQALAKWQETGDVSSIDVSAIPGLRLEAPGACSRTAPRLPCLSVTVNVMPCRSCVISMPATELLRPVVGGGQTLHCASRHASTSSKLDAQLRCSSPHNNTNKTTCFALRVHSRSQHPTTQPSSPSPPPHTCSPHSTTTQGSY
jgi:hypothetical protein